MQFSCNLSAMFGKITLETYVQCETEIYLNNACWWDVAATYVVVTVSGFFDISLWGESLACYIRILTRIIPMLNTF